MSAGLVETICSQVQDPISTKSRSVWRTAHPNSDANLLPPTASRKSPPLSVDPPLAAHAPPRRVRTKNPFIGIRPHPHEDWNKLRGQISPTPSRASLSLFLSRPSPDGTPRRTRRAHIPDSSLSPPYLLPPPPPHPSRPSNPPQAANPLSRSRAREGIRTFHFTSNFRVQEPHSPNSRNPFASDQPPARLGPAPASTHSRPVSCSAFLSVKGTRSGAWVDQ